MVSWYLVTSNSFVVSESLENNNQKLTNLIACDIWLLFHDMLICWCPLPKATQKLLDGALPLESSVLASSAHLSLQKMTPQLPPPVRSWQIMWSMRISRRGGMLSYALFSAQVAIPECYAMRRIDFLQDAHVSLAKVRRHSGWLVWLWPWTKSLWILLGGDRHCINSKLGGHAAVYLRLLHCYLRQSMEQIRPADGLQQFPMIQFCVKSQTGR